MARDFADSAVNSIPPAVVRESAVVRFAGDSGDGMQLSGSQFTLSTALAGNALATFPDFPAEIRAPQGSTFGVSAFQINFGSTSIETAGDEPDVLIAMNPAALKVNLAELRPGGLIIVDSGAFGERNLRKAGYEANPLEDSTLARFEVVPLDIARLTLDARALPRPKRGTPTSPTERRTCPHEQVGTSFHVDRPWSHLTQL